MKKILRTAMVLFALGSVGYYLWRAATMELDEYMSVDDRFLGPHMVALVVPIVVLSVGFALTGDSTMMAMTGKNSAAFRDGLVGIGTIVSAERTGMSINDQPELRFELDVVGAHGETFRSRAKAVVPLLQLAEARPGSMIPVRYLPGRYDKVELDRSGDATLARAAIEHAMIQSGHTTPEALEISRNGVPAQGVIRTVTVTGELRNGRPKLDLDIVVTRPDGTTFEVHKSPFVPATAVQYLQVGRVVEVHYLPHDESRSTFTVPAS